MSRGRSWRMLRLTHLVRPETPLLHFCTYPFSPLESTGRVFAPPVALASCESRDLFPPPTQAHNWHIAPILLKQDYRFHTTGVGAIVSWKVGLERGCQLAPCRHTSCSEWRSSRAARQRWLAAAAASQVNPPSIPIRPVWGSCLRVSCRCECVHL